MNNQGKTDVEHTAEIDIVDDRPRRPVLRFLRKTLILLAIFIAFYLVGILLMSIVSIDKLHEAQRGLDQFGEWWMLVRLAFIAGLMISWVRINTWLARHNGWSKAHLARVLAGRWITLVTLTFVELFLVQRIHEPFTDKWFQ